VDAREMEFKKLKRIFENTSNSKCKNQENPFYVDT